MKRERKEKKGLENVRGQEVRREGDGAREYAHARAGRQRKRNAERETEREGLTGREREPKRETEREKERMCLLSLLLSVFFSSL